jgi:hypothetical protein
VTKAPGKTWALTNTVYKNSLAFNRNRGDTIGIQTLLSVIIGGVRTAIIALPLSDCDV